MKSFFAASALFLTLCAAGCSVAPTTDVSSAQALETSVVQVVDTAAGKVLANAQGLSLYTFDRDTTTESTCYDNPALPFPSNVCATHWPALLAPDDQKLAAPFGITTRTDGKKQVTFNGDPLYTFFEDEVQGDIKGDGLGRVWHLARPTVRSS